MIAKICPTHDDHDSYYQNKIYFVVHRLEQLADGSYDAAGASAGEPSVAGQLQGAAGAGCSCAGSIPVEDLVSSELAILPSSSAQMGSLWPSHRYTMAASVLSLQNTCVIRRSRRLKRVLPILLQYFQNFQFRCLPTKSIANTNILMRSVCVALSFFPVFSSQHIVVNTLRLQLCWVELLYAEHMIAIRIN